MLSQLDWTRTATYAKLRKSTEDVQSHAMDFVSVAEHPEYCR